MSRLTVAVTENWRWLGGSLLIALLWTNLAWLLSRRSLPGAWGAATARLLSWRFSPWIFQILRLVYYLGLPFAALVWGHDALIGRLFGLQPLALSSAGADAHTAAGNWLDWARDVGWAAVWGGGAWLALALGWLTYRRAAVAAGGGPVPAGADASGWVLLREAAYHEAHWAFYRNAPLVTWGPYWGLWGGLAWVGLEALLNPAWRDALTDPARAPERLMRTALAVVSSAFFQLTQNLWLAVLLHWLVSWGWAVWTRAFPCEGRSIIRPYLRQQ